MSAHLQSSLLRCLLACVVGRDPSEAVSALPLPLLTFPENCPLLLFPIRKARPLRVYVPACTPHQLSALPPDCQGPAGRKKAFAISKQTAFLFGGVTWPLSGLSQGTVLPSGAAFPVHGASKPLEDGTARPSLCLPSHPAPSRDPVSPGGACRC